MTETPATIDDNDTAAPVEPGTQHPRQDAGQDESIAKRLERDPENKQAQLDNALDESMDASDPPATTQPGQGHEPPASSGYNPEQEKADR